MLQRQLRIAAAMFLLGVMIILLYDIIIASRDSRKKKTFVKIIEDFIFWQISAGAVFYVIYTLNEGIIRGYEIAACFFGMILTHVTVGRKLIKGLKYLFFHCRIKLRILFDRFNR